MSEDKKSNFYFSVAPNVWGMKDIFVNIYMIKNAAGKDWVLVDAGLKTSSSKIKKMAQELFDDTKPKAIILTHGHFDHVGSLKNLIAEWKAAVYAHYLELPYLTGRSNYPPADPSVGGGMMAYMSFLYPSKSTDISSSIYSLPEDGSVPGLKGWRYIHTAGHSPGHISLYREEDGVLIAGDAFVTTKAESALAVLLQLKKISRPPAYFTPDWKAAGESIKQLLFLTPEVVATGHGMPMSGPEMRKELHHLHEHFNELAIPKNGRYSKEPAVADANGVLYIPKEEPDAYKNWLIASSVIAITALAATIVFNKNRRSR